MNPQAVMTALLPDQAVALTIFGEARAESFCGRLAVGCTIRNRLLAKSWYGDDWKEVCHKKWQYSCWIKYGGEANFWRVIETGYKVSINQIACPQIKLARLIMDGSADDITDGATHYYAKWLKQPPKWAQGKEPCAEFGVHLFYKDVD